jgi:hypothetical protein
MKDLLDNFQFHFEVNVIYSSVKKLHVFENLGKLEIILTI